MSAQGAVGFLEDVMGEYKEVYEYLCSSNSNIQEIIYEGINRTQGVFYEPLWSDIQTTDTVPDTPKKQNRDLTWMTVPIAGALDAATTPIPGNHPEALFEVDDLEEEEYTDDEF